MNKILRPRQVCSLVGLSPMQVWRLRRDGKFPEPITLGINSKGYLADEIDSWIEERRAQRDAKLQNQAKKSP